MVTIHPAFVHVADGSAQNVPAPGVAVLEAPRRAERVRARERLFVLIELNGPGPVAGRVYRELMATLAETYYQSTGSTTAALRGALQAAHVRLLRDNATAPPGTQIVGGALCVMVRDGPAPGEAQLFLAQAGPTVAYLSREGLVDRIPESGDDEARTPLGLHQTLDVHFVQETVKSGDVLLLSESRLTRLMTDARVGEFVADARADEVVRLLHLHVRDSDLSGLVLEFGHKAQAGEVPFAGESRTGALGRLPGLFKGGVTLPRIPAIALPGRRAAPAESPPSTEVPVGRSSPKGEAGPGAPAAAGPPHEGAYPSASGWPRQATVVNPFVGREPLGSEEPDEVDELEQFDSDGEPAGQRFAFDARGALHGVQRSLVLGLSSLSAGAGVLLARTLPDAADERRPLQAQGVVPGWVVWLAAVLIPLIVAGLTVTAWVQRGEALESQEAFTRGREEAALAQAAATPEEQRIHWQAALAAYRDAWDKGLRDSALSQARDQAQAALDVLDDVTRLRARLLRDFGAGALPTGVIFQNLNLFTLEAAGGRVYLDEFNDNYTALVNPASQAVIFPGQRVDNRTVGKIIDIAWLAAGGAQRDSVLLALDANGVLATYSPAWGARATALVGANEWKKARAITTYLDRLYVLDPPAGQMWRYEPSEQGFIQPPSTYFSAGAPPALENTLDFSIDTSGNVYMLQSDGTIAKYFNSTRAPFEISDLKLPVRQPSAFFIGPDPLVSSIYIAEPIEGRIVRLSQGGKFLDQYRVDGEVFDDIRALYVDEANGRFFVASGTMLYMAESP